MQKFLLGDLEQWFPKWGIQLRRYRTWSFEMQEKMEVHDVLLIITNSKRFCKLAANSLSDKPWSWTNKMLYIVGSLYHPRSIIILMLPCRNINLSDYMVLLWTSKWVLCTVLQTQHIIVLKSKSINLVPSILKKGGCGLSLKLLLLHLLFF